MLRPLAGGRAPIHWHCQARANLSFAGGPAAARAGAATAAAGDSGPAVHRLIFIQSSESASGVNAPESCFSLLLLDHELQNGAELCETQDLDMYINTDQKFGVTLFFMNGCL